MSIEYNKKNISLAKQLRKYATPQENHLWYDFLAKYPIRFQRQKAIGNFIVDFYCHKAKLVIEIDGSEHFSEDGIRNDEFRTEILEEFDLRVIRFSIFVFICLPPRGRWIFAKQKDGRSIRKLTIIAILLIVIAIFLQSTSLTALALRCSVPPRL